jgi:type IV fimbrial biogenesis protein FimT
MVALPKTCRSGGRAGRAHGISLIEVLVTLTILGMLLVAVLPSIGNWMRNTEIRNAAESIQNGLTKARAEAVKRNEIITFSLVSSAADGQFAGSCELSSASGSWVASVDDPSGKCAVSVSDTLSPFTVAKQAVGDGAPNVTVTVCDANNAVTSVAFNGYGRVAATPAWATGPLQCIEVSNTTATGTRRLNVVIGTGGTVRMCDPAVTSNDDPRKC